MPTIVPTTPPPALENLPEIVRAVFLLVVPSPTTFSVVQLTGPMSLEDFWELQEESE